MQKPEQHHLFFPTKSIKRPDLLAIGTLTIVTIIAYWPILSGKGTIWNDFIEQYFPYRTFATDALKNHQFPFWNPYSFSGMPFFADIQSAVLYPLNLLLVLFSGKGGLNALLFEYQIITHILLAGIFTYALARDFKRSRTASLVAGLTFMLSGFATTHIFHITMIHALPWFSLVFLLFRCALDRASITYAVFTGIVLCFIAFAGHPQLFLFVNYLLAAWLLYHLITNRKKKSFQQRIAAPTTLFLITIIIGGGLSAVQLLPTSELGKESVRPEMEFSQSAQGSFRPYRLITLVAPNFFGRPDTYSNKSPSYWGITHHDVDPGAHYYWETALYVGIIPLVLALLALIFLRSPPVLFWGTTALISFLIAMGDAGPLYHLAYSFMPGFKLFRNPARIGIVFSLAMAILAAFGSDTLFGSIQQRTNRSKRKLLIIAGTLAAVVVLTASIFSAGGCKQAVTNFLAGSGFFGNNIAQVNQYVDQSIYPYATRQIWIFVIFALLALGIIVGSIKKMLPARMVSVLVPLIVACDLLLFGYGFAANHSDPRSIYPENTLVKSIRNEYKQELFRFNSRSSKQGSDDIGGGEMIFKRNEGSVQKIFLMEGYNPLRLKRQLVDRKQRTLDILNVKYKISVDREKQSMGIEPNESYLPRVWIATTFVVERNEAKILPLLHQSDFDYRKSVILEEEPALTFTIPSQQHSAHITTYNLNSMAIEVATDKPALLIVSEINYPAWKATIDNKPAKVLRADYALRAVAVPEGKHNILLTYRDAAFFKGLVISLICAMVAIGLLLFDKLRPRGKG